MIIDQVFERECEELLIYLYELAARKYAGCNDLDSLVQDTIIAYVTKRVRGETVEHPKGFLSAVMKNRYNEYLRRRYKHQTVSFESFDPYSDAGLEALGTDEEFDDEERDEEYAKVRREIGRLIKIYREVTVRHYVHGHSIEQIADELGISQGTVKSRLSNARNQIKEGIGKMEKYSSLSYEPKKVSIGIWGGDSIRSEPFTLLHSLIEGNILYLAYEKPITIKEIADTLGMPAAYVEPLVDKLVEGELMGRTEGGLVYTRCYMCSWNDTLGDVERQEAKICRNCLAHSLEAYTALDGARAIHHNERKAKGNNDTVRNRPLYHSSDVENKADATTRLVGIPRATQRWKMVGVVDCLRRGK